MTTTDQPESQIPESQIPESQIVELLRAVETQLHESEIGFQLDKARLYGATVNPSSAKSADDDSQTPGFRLCFLDAHCDIYELLDRPSSAVARVFDAAVIVTTGWATPVESLVGMQRRRVRLVVVVCDDGVASALRFVDAADQVLIDEGTATGALNDAVDHFWFKGNNSEGATVAITP